MSTQSISLLLTIAALVLGGCASTQNFETEVTDRPVKFEESWGFYGLAIYFCDVTDIDGRSPPPPGWTNKRKDVFELPGGEHQISVWCDVGKYPRIGTEFFYTMTLQLEAGHHYKVDYSFLRGACVYVKDLTANEVVFDNGSCGW